MHYKINFFLFLFLIVLFIGLNSGCGLSTSSYKIYLITMDKTNSYWKALDDGCQQAVKEIENVNYRWIAPVERNAIQQAECIDKAVADGADAILVSAVSLTDINESLSNADKAGVKIIYVDSAASFDGIITLMTDNEAAGKMAAKTMLKALQEAGVQSGTIGIIANDVDAQNTTLRENGFRTMFKGTPFAVAPTIYMDNNPQVIVNSMIEQRDYVGYFGSNNYSTIVIGEEVKNLGTGQVIVGFDTADTTIELIKEGIIYATMQQNVEVMGREGIEYAVQALQGKFIDKNVIKDTGVTVITKDKLE